MLYNGNGLSSFSQSQNSTLTVVATGDQSLGCLSTGSPMGQGGVGTSTVLGSSSTTLTSAGLYSYTDHEEGKYAASTFALSCLAYQEAAQGASTFTAASQQTVTTHTTGPQVLNALNTQSSSLACTQHASSNLYALGTYNSNGGWNLSSYNLTSYSGQTATQTLAAGGTYNAVGTDSSGNSYSSYGVNSLAQSTYQAMSGTLTEAGKYSGSSFALSLVSFSDSGATSFTYRRTDNTSYTSANSATNSTDSTAVNAGGQSSYTSTGQGSWASTGPQGYNSPGALSLSSFTLSGGSTGSSTLQSSGNAGTVAYSHQDTWNETVTLNEAGTYSPVGYSTAGNGYQYYAPAGWSFTNYNSTTQTSESVTDMVAGLTTTATINELVTVTGVGAAGTSSATASGSYYWSGNAAFTAFTGLPSARNYWFGSTTKSSAVTLSGAALPALNPSQTPANWMLTPGGGLLWTPSAQLSSVTGKVLAPPLGVAAASAPSGLLASPALAYQSLGLTAPPLLLGVSRAVPVGGFTAAPAPGNGNGLSSSGWFPGPGSSLLTTNWNVPPWGVLNQLNPSLLALLNQALVAASTRPRVNLNPFALSAASVFQAAVTLVGATPSGDLGAVVGALVDFVAGIVNTVSGGLAARLFNEFSSLTGVSVAGIVNTSSKAYQAGEVVGQVVLVVLRASPVGPLVMALQAVSMAWNAYDAVQRGDTMTAVLDLTLAAAALVGAGEALEAADGLIGSAQNALETPAAVETESLAAVESEAGASLETLETSLPTEPGTSLTEPNPTAELPQENIGDYQVNEGVNSEEASLGNCFPAGTDVHTLNGLRAVETVKSGDRVWAYDLVAGLWRPCRVLQAFSKQYDGHSTFVTFAGETVESTSLHPYWVVRGEGLAERPVRPHLPTVPQGATTLGRWVDAVDVRVGDEILLRVGRIVPVEAVRTAPYHGLVYNFSVAELQCYSVGAAGVLVHNSSGDPLDASSGLGDLTVGEVKKIQAVVDEAGRPLEVVGSAARGTRRGVGTDLPIGKDPEGAPGTTRSDIDYVTSVNSLPYFDAHLNELPSIDPETGVLRGPHDLTEGPSIRFEPGEPPVFRPQKM